MDLTTLLVCPGGGATCVLGVAGVAVAGARGVAGVPVAGVAACCKGKIPCVGWGVVHRLGWAAWVAWAAGCVAWKKPERARGRAAGALPVITSESCVHEGEHARKVSSGRKVLRTTRMKKG